MKPRKRLLSILVAAALGVSANSYGVDDTATWSQDGVQALSKGATFNGHAVVPNQVLVKFKEDVQAEDADTALFTMGMWEIKSYDQSGAALLGADKRRMSKQDQSAMSAEESLKEIIAELEGSGVVEYAEPNYILSADVNSNDPRFNELWGLSKIDAPAAWSMTTGDPNIVVGVIDTGVDYNHPDLAANMWVNPGETPNNGIDDDGNGYVDDIYGIDPANGDSDPMDDGDHGSHVSGTIGAVGNNGVGVVGVNWNVKIMALKFLRGSGSGSTSDALECLEYALKMKRDHNVNVKLTSNSWGGGGFSRIMKDTIEETARQGMLFIAAAGNDNTNNDQTPHYPSNYDLPSVISVASTTSSDARSSFSNYGRTSVDLAAPGSNILSTIPGGYSSFSGTSMATPHVAGAAAMVWAVNPGYTPAEVKELIMGSVVPLTDFTNRTVSGGRLDLLSALNCNSGSPALTASLADDFLAEVGQEVVLTASLRDCTPLSVANLSVTFDNGDPSLTLEDNGQGADAHAGDGIYSAGWTPAGLANPVTLTFDADYNGSRYTLPVLGSVVPFQGYRYDDTVEYHWEDISASGTALNLSDDDFANVDLPFAFNFHGTDRTRISIGSNGLVYFDNDDFGKTYSNEAIPNNATSHDYIALLWDDWDPSSGGEIYHKTLGSGANQRFIIQYDNIPHYTGGGGGSPYFLASGPGTFQLVLYKDSGEIFMEFKDVNFNDANYDNGASATVGIQKNQSSGQQYSYNLAAVSNESAIRWYQDTGTPPIDPPPPSTTVDFNSAGMRAYSDQDVADTGTIAEPRDGGDSFFLLGNRWQKSAPDVTFDITPNTVLEFDFKSNVEGEIHAIGFDETHYHRDGARLFQIYGNQVFSRGIQNDVKYTGNGAIQHFMIKVGEYYTGDNKRLVLANDEDTPGAVDNDSWFSNVKVYEQTP